MGQQRCQQMRYVDGWHSPDACWVGELAYPQTDITSQHLVGSCMQTCRTDTAQASRTPVFSSSTFLLRVPTQTAPAKLAVSLFAAPSVEAPAGPIIAGAHVCITPPTVAPTVMLQECCCAACECGGGDGEHCLLSALCAASGFEVDRLVASGVLELEQHLAQRLWAGEHVAVPLTLQVARDCRVQQMPEGMGSQVSHSPGVTLQGASACMVGCSMHVACD